MFESSKCLRPRRRINQASVRFLTYLKVYPRRLAPAEMKELVEKGISTYKIERTISGWRFSWFPDGTHNCDKEGKHYLYKALHEDGVAYPAQLGKCLRRLWTISEGKNENWIEPKINSIGRWISATDRKKPQWL